MTDPRIIIAVLCGLVVGLVLVLAIVGIKARKAAEQHARDKADAEALVAKLIGERDDANSRWRWANIRNNRAIQQLDEAHQRLDEASTRIEALDAILDVAYVRGDRGHFQRYRPQQVAA